MNFKCNQCDSKRLVETMGDVSVDSVCWFEASGQMIYGDQTNSCGEVIGYQCENGHWVKDAGGEKITDRDELFDFLHGGEVLDFDEVIDKITKRLCEIGNNELAKIHNEMFEQKLKYGGDSFFEWEKE